VVNFPGLFLDFRNFGRQNSIKIPEAAKIPGSLRNLGAVVRIGIWWVAI
jgi:hypothetical protein